MATRLKNLSVTKVALVDAGANPDADVMLFKMAAVPPTSKEAPVAEVSKSAEELAARVAELETEREALTQISNDDLAALRGFEIVASTPTEDIDKSALPESVRKALEEGEELRARVEKMEADNRRASFIAKAADFPLVAGADELGPALEQIDRLAPDAAQVIERTLKAANARIAEGGLFGEVGASGADGTESEAEALIAAEVAKGTPRHDAIRKVFSERPELYPAQSA